MLDQTYFDTMLDDVSFFSVFFHYISFQFLNESEKYDLFFRVKSSKNVKRCFDVQSECS